MLYICNVNLKILNVMIKVSVDTLVFGGIEYTSSIVYTKRGFMYKLSYIGSDAKRHYITFSSVLDYSDFICFLQLKDLAHV